MANVAASPTTQVAAGLRPSVSHEQFNQMVPLLFNYGSAVGLVVLNKSVSCVGPSGTVLLACLLVPSYTQAPHAHEFSNARYDDHLLWVLTREAACLFVAATPDRYSSTYASVASASGRLP
jgi:hypothetical protein